jgi:hypothetical protein
MKVKNQWWQNARPMPVSNEVLPDDCFSVGVVTAAKAKSRQRGSNRRFCRRLWLASASIREAEKIRAIARRFFDGKSQCKGLLPENAIYLGFHPDFARSTLCNP